MKTLKKVLFCMILALAASCTHSSDKILTVINSDGSCRRVISTYADSSFMAGKATGDANPFAIEIDSTYSLAWQYKGVGEVHTEFPIGSLANDSLIPIVTERSSKREKVFLVFAGRDYKSVEEMGKEFRLKPSHPWSNMEVKYSLEKKFRLFYTYFTYKETYPHLETPFQLPIENYMSEEEADFWFTGKPNLLLGMNGLEVSEYTDNLNNRYNRWLAQNIWDMEYELVIKHYDMVKNPPISKEELMRLKDTVFMKNAQDDTFDMEQCLNRYFKTNAFSILWEKEFGPLAQFDTEINDHPVMQCLETSLDYRLIMPGEIISTNGVNSHDTLNWNLTAFRMLYGDYVIEAQSRKINIWMLSLIGLFALTAVAMFIYRRRV